jgi:hypothetical protein
VPVKGFSAFDAFAELFQRQGCHRLVASVFHYGHITESEAHRIFLGFVLCIPFGHHFQEVSEVRLSCLDAESSAVVVMESQLVEPWGIDADCPQFREHTLSSW